MKVKILLKDKEKLVEVDEGGTIEDVMEKLGINPEEYLAVVEGKIVPDNMKVKDNMLIKMIKVVTGG